MKKTLTLKIDATTPEPAGTMPVVAFRFTVTAPSGASVTQTVTVTRAAFSEMGHGNYIARVEALAADGSVLSQLPEIAVVILESLPPAPGLGLPTGLSYTVT